jgi:hypothetical protein
MIDAASDEIGRIALAAPRVTGSRIPGNPRSTVSLRAMTRF